MTDTRNSPMNANGKHIKPQSLVRVEVEVRKGHESLMHDVADVLGDPHQEATLRDVLRNLKASRKTKNLKTLLTAVSLEGIELDRPRDFGRESVF
ncbi:MAG: hypothetical protein ACR2PR_05045 [Pseudohongiellaceae bacterium]